MISHILVRSFGAARNNVTTSRNLMSATFIPTVHSLKTLMNTHYWPFCIRYMFLLIVTENCNTYLFLFLSLKVRSLFYASDCVFCLFFLEWRRSIATVPIQIAISRNKCFIRSLLPLRYFQCSINWCCHLARSAYLSEGSRVRTHFTS